MALVGILLTIAVPLISFITVLGLGLSGGFKFPLAWTLTFVVAVITSYTLAFLCFKHSSSHRTKLFITISIVLLAILVSLAVGYLAAGSGVLADYSQDPSGGDFLVVKTLFWSVWGSFSGYYVGVGTLYWITVLTAQVGLDTRLATGLSILIACLSFSSAIVILLM